MPVEKWEGVYNATADGPLCPQPTKDPISEDCLLLNVYSTKVKNTLHRVNIYCNGNVMYSYQNPGRLSNVQ